MSAELNPLAITDDELTKLEQVCAAISRQPKKLELRGAKGKVQYVEVVDAQQTRTGISARVVARCVTGGTPSGSQYGELLIAAAEYLYLLPLAIRTLRGQKEAKS